VLVQGDMIVLEYERRFNNLSMFDLPHVSTEHSIIKMLLDGLQQKLRQGLISIKFDTARELIEVAKALEACMSEG
jgi:hypothetical protein